MEIVNRVEESGIITLDLEEYYPSGERAIIDIKDNLFQGLILREKDFREFIKTNDWTQYQDKLVALTCSADAIVPTWAYMMVANQLHGIAKDVVFGNLDTLETVLITKSLKEKIDPESFIDKKVVIKGCSNVKIPESAYVELTSIIRPYVSSLMYGEPCSTVPVYKKPKVNRTASK